MNEEGTLNNTLCDWVNMYLMKDLILTLDVNSPLSDGDEELYEGSRATQFMKDPYLSLLWKRSFLSLRRILFLLRMLAKKTFSTLSLIDKRPESDRKITANHITDFSVDALPKTFFYFTFFRHFLSQNLRPIKAQTIKGKLDSVDLDRLRLF